MLAATKFLPLVWALLDEGQDLLVLVTHFDDADRARLTQLTFFIDWRDAPHEVEGWKIESGPALHDLSIDLLVGEVEKHLRGEGCDYLVDNIRQVSAAMTEAA